MNHQNIQRMNDFFAERIAGCEQRGTALKADERGDEAVNEKVRANIFDVFRTVLSAAEKAGRGDTKAVRSFFRDRLEIIPSGWAKKLFLIEICACDLQYLKQVMN